MCLEVICGRIFHIQFSGNSLGCLSVVGHIMLTRDEDLSQIHDNEAQGHFDSWNGHGEPLTGKVIQASVSDGEAVL